MERKDKDNIEISQLSSTKKETVCAVVVTYNRKELLLECLEALRKQTRPLDAIYIIDNASTDNTPKILLENKYIPKLSPSDLIEPWEISSSILSSQMQTNEFQTLITIHYVRMHENTGGAGGFHEGAKRGYEAGYDWLWLMDDDALPDGSALQQLVICREESEEAMILVPLQIDPDNGIKYGTSFWRKGRSVKPEDRLISGVLPFRSDIFSFVGPLIHSTVLEKIGMPNKDYFIWYDDVDYALRAKIAGIPVYVVPQSQIVHRWGLTKKEVRFFGKVKILPVFPAWKIYYTTRNQLNSILRTIKSLEALYFFAKFQFRAIVRDLLYERDRVIRVRMRLKGLWDGLLGKLGCTILPM